MALQELEFTFEAEHIAAEIPEGWTHTGVVGSGDLEILMEYKEQDGKVSAKIVTPVKGYEDVWKLVLDKFVQDSGLGNASIEINDNNATPFIVSIRLRQALAEAREEREQ